MADEDGTQGEQEQGAKILQYPGPDRNEALLERVRAGLTRCYRGPIKSYVDSLRTATEASDNYHMCCYITVAGLLVGRRAHAYMGRRKYPTFYVCLVGDTAVGRKSSAIDFAFDMIEEAAPDRIEQFDSSSYEGLLGIMARKAEENGGVPPPFLMKPGEYRSLAQLIQQKGTQRMGSGLVDMYDGKNSIAHHTRSASVKVERPVLGIITSSTPEWLRDSLERHDPESGFSNRWIFAEGRRRGLLPLPTDPIEESWVAARDALVEMDERLRGYPEAQGGLRVELTAEAKRHWVQIYNETEGRFVVPEPAEEEIWGEQSEMLAKMGARFQDHMLKFAMISALLEGSDVITLDHLKAGMALVRWQRVAQLSIFGDWGKSDLSKLEDRVEKYLERHWETRKEPMPFAKLRQCFGGKVSARDIQRVLQTMDQVGAAHALDGPRGGLLIARGRPPKGQKGS